MFDIFLCIWYNVFMGKDMFTINKNDLSYGRGYVYSLQYHLVWCTKYRKKVLKDGIDVECKEMLESLAPVSYTHLDVYKRQIFMCGILRNPALTIICVLRLARGKKCRRCLIF